MINSSTPPEKFYFPATDERVCRDMEKVFSDNAYEEGEGNDKTNVSNAFCIKALDDRKMVK